VNLPPEARQRNDLTALLERHGEEPTPDAIALLVQHLKLLERWNTRHHLTAIEVWEEILDRHIGESLMPLRWIGPKGRLLDIGTGNGYPALPILACRPGLESVLVERSERKCLFLDAVLRGAGRSGVRILTREAAPRTGAAAADPPFDHVISRATLPAARYLEIAASWTRPQGGQVFVYGGGEVGAIAGRRDLHGLGLEHVELIPGRRDSFLYVLAAGAPAGESGRGDPPAL